MDKEKLLLDFLDEAPMIKLRGLCQTYNIKGDFTGKRSLLVKKLIEVISKDIDNFPFELKEKKGKHISSENTTEAIPEKEASLSVAPSNESEVNEVEIEVETDDSLSLFDEESDDKPYDVESESATDDEEKEEKEAVEEKKDIPAKNKYNGNSGKRTSSSNKDYNSRPSRSNYETKSKPNGKAKKNIPQQKGDPHFMGDGEIDLNTCEIRSGILEICQDGFGFLRAESYRNSNKDTFVSSFSIRKFGLREGDFVEAYAKSSDNGKPPALVLVNKINEHPYAEGFKRPFFEDFVPIYPDKILRLEVKSKRGDLAARAIDLIAPIGKGQRAMVVSPPKAGKTTLLKMIANSISTNHPECKLMVLLIDERPEEVTDMQRSISGEVIFSTFDEESDNHIRVAKLVLERAKRMVEDGMDVVILLDSLTRMARANNVIVPSSGKTLSGGVDPVALYFPKRFFGAARNIENGGSLTIIATALVDTGSRMDDIVYEEFKGTGNMEVHLDRRLSEKRIFPAIDLYKSGTRREELLLTQQELEGAYSMRKLLSAGDPQEAAESIINMMMRTGTNAELIVCLKDQIAKLKKDGYRF